MHPTSTPPPDRRPSEDTRQVERGTAMSDLVLSLFPGIGLLDMAFEEAGFCVVRGPDALWGGDVRRFHPPAGRFDGIIGGPPCQAFSAMRHMVIQRYGEAKLAENLIPEFERCISEARPAWFLMENVPAAPLPVVAGYVVDDMVLNNRWFGGEQERKRRFSFGVFGDRRIDLRRWLDVELFEPVQWEPAVMASRGQGVKMGSSGKIKPGYERKPSSEYLADTIRLQGLPDDFLDHAPFTSEGKQKVVGNGVPLPMGRAIANAVREALAVYGAAGG